MMGAIDITLSANQRPSFCALIACAHEIALTHGEDAAVDWTHRILAADFDLFVQVSAEITPPMLRIIPI